MFRYLFISRIGTHHWNLPSKHAGSQSLPVRSGGKQWSEADRMFLAHRLASGPDPFGQNLTQSARTKPDPGWFCTKVGNW